MTSPRSYCNSILQCLYFSVPFRQAVVNYPARTPIESLEAALAKNLRYQDPQVFFEAEAQAAKQKTQNPPPASRGPNAAPNQQQKPEDKDSPEYKKKVAIQTQPLLETKSNAASYGMSESLFTSMKDIFESIIGSQTRVGVIRPRQFLDVLRQEHEMFRTAMHQDAHEFLNLLLNEVVANVEMAALKQPAIEGSLAPAESEESTDQLAPSTGSKTPSTTRWVHELFEGTLTSETQCLTCEKVSQRDEVFLDLSVDLEQHSSVTSCLRKFSEEEMLCERNKFHCDNCGGLQEAEKRMKVKRLPRILALHLKRFKYTEDLQRLQKLFHRVVYPYHLRLFNTTDDAEDPDRLYELYAVVVHIGGGPYHGHYVAIIKTEDQGWLLFDDELVEPVDKNYVRNFFGDRPGLACAYVLFYQETTLEAMLKEQEQEDMSSNVVSDLNEASAKQNGFAQSPLAHVQSASQVPSTDDSAKMSAIKKMPTAPALPTQSEYSETEGNAQPSAPSPDHSVPPVPPVPDLPSTPLSWTKSNAQSKKERAREEKERKAAEKAAEKEREKNDRQRRKEEETRRRENYRREEAEMKAAIEASKASKADEDKRQTLNGGKENHESAKKLGNSLSILKRRSRSFSAKRGRDKDLGRTLSTDVPPERIPEQPRRTTTEPPAQQAEKDPSLPRQSSKPSPADDSLKDPKHDRSGHGKWKHFGIRKKSLSIAS